MEAELFTFNCEKVRDNFILTMSGDNSGKASVDSLIIDVTNSGIESRKAIYIVIYKRLKRYFETKNQTITRDTELKTILNPSFTEKDWIELNQIGLAIPGLQRTKYFNGIIATYLITAISCYNNLSHQEH